jgi:hypothetical protein
MKKMLSFLLVLTLLCGCGVKKKTMETTPTRMLILIDTTFTKAQLDSLCISDTLSMDLQNWNNVVFVDYETNQAIYEYLYIKNINEDVMMYRVIKEGDEYKIIKRLTDN